MSSGNSIIQHDSDNPETPYSHFPRHVTLNEVGPRDGFQFESRFIPTLRKIDIIHALMHAGLKHIQATSFVNPMRVPQMADAEEVIRGLVPPPDTIVSALVLNSKGIERAALAGLKWVEISISASDTHSRKNAGISGKSALAAGIDMIRLAHQKRLNVIAGIQCVFGYAHEGDVPIQRIPDIIRAYHRNSPFGGIHRLMLSDTAGLATPLTINRILNAALPTVSPIPIGLHLHDTRGMGLVNVMAGLERGISYFDTALGGIGGCPFIPNAAGNIATEDTACLLKSLGIDTGINIASVSAGSLALSDFLGKPFPGKLYSNMNSLCLNNDTHASTASGS